VRISRACDPPIDVTDLTVTAAFAAEEHVRPLLRLVSDNGDSLVYKTDVRGPLPFKKANFGIHEIHGSPDLSMITEIRISFWAGEDRSRTFWVDELKFGERLETGKVHISFDDTHETDHTKALPVLESHGFEATTFLNPKAVGNDRSLTLGQLDALADAGWDIANHTWSHARLPDLTEPEQETEIRKGYEWLLEHGFERGTEFFSYPFGAFDRTTLEVVETYHSLGFDGGFTPFGSVENPHIIPRAPGDLSESKARELIDATAEYRGITPLFYHRLDDSIEPEFRRTISYLSELETKGLIDVVTSSDLDR
jgi:peptidoglycan/xylan/chitin deacetylase (PgdA/CDA1 family)